MIEYTIEELLKIQKMTTERSKNPGILVISKRDLSRFVSQKLGFIVSVPVLNKAIEKYCNRSKSVQLILGAKRYNVIAEKVPHFLDWFFAIVHTKPTYISDLQKEYEKWHKEGFENRKKRKTKTIVNLDVEAI